MKTLTKIVVAAVAINASTAFAFFENGNIDNRFVQDGRGDVVGNATGEGDASGSAKFSLTFSGRAKSAGDFKGNGIHNTNYNARGYGYENPYYSFPAPKAK